MILAISYLLDTADVYREYNDKVIIIYVYLWRWKNRKIPARMILKNAKTDHVTGCHLIGMKIQAWINEYSHMSVATEDTTMAS